MTDSDADLAVILGRPGATSPKGPFARPNLAPGLPLDNTTFPQVTTPFDLAPTSPHLGPQDAD
jgi:hypothetical protein